ncbi:PIN domain-containing protein [Thauera aromatica]|uniref:Ribonuclease VapC n=1 Tax=Thauera aromatica K172 TaxID=44139 RepID=A0A2R4BJ19_THAAR|nr:PIN domain-containing protein [Thauera aromatica]AVR87310.1 VapC toxin protein [Thauera aromatica K172]
MTHLLDTNIFIAALKAHPAVRARLESLPASAVVLSPIVLGELQTGVEKSEQVERNRARLEQVVAGLAVPRVDAATSAHYARIRAALERQGTPIGGNDLWIAAQALALGAVLVTDNVKEFSRVPGLVVENWLAQ